MKKQEMNSSRMAITLPSALQRLLEQRAMQFLQPEHAVRKIDFSAPMGAPALVEPNSVSWRVFKNPLALFIGGVAAVILELAEPRVRTGVWEHTSFRSNPLARLQRTGLAAMMTVYGPRAETEAMIAGISRLHARISGTTPCGHAYRADDPELLNWVHATAGFGFLEAYHAYAHPLSDEERERYYAEGQSSARLYGATGAPTSQRQAAILFDAMRGKLEASPIVFEFIEIMQRVPLVPQPFIPFQKMLVQAAVELVPSWIRERLGLDERWNLRPWQRALVKRSGATADRILLRPAPAVQSCRRLGLSDDYLYTKR